MPQPPNFEAMSCDQCRNAAKLDFNFTMAFQPIIDIRSGKVFAQEALVRGLENQPAGEVFAKVSDANRYRFDQACRVKALELASRLNIDSYLNINFMPNAVYKPELCIRTTLEAASTFGFPKENIIFEITESEQVTDLPHLKSIVDYYRNLGFKIAIDDFGAGYAGLNFLADIPADIIKLDMHLIRDIHLHKTRQSIVRATCQVADDLNLLVIAEGIESQDELCCLQDMGIFLFQGYYLARPSFESLADIDPKVIPG